MSDPVTHEDVEDVLSSIRKLVADEVRAAPVLRPSRKKDRLLLTADQRVPDEGSKPPPILLTQPLLPEGRAECAQNGVQPMDSIPREARLIEYGQVPDDPAAEQPSTTSDQGAPSAAGRAPFWREGPAATGTAGDAEDAPQAAGLLTLEDKITALTRLVAGENDAPQAQSFEDDRDWPEAETLPIVSSPMDWSDAPLVEGAGRQEVSSHGDASPRGPAPETALETGASSSPTTLSDIDQDMLRPLVTEIVRRELQGALGERITRNVRKLVLREINRALTAEGLD